MRLPKILKYSNYSKLYLAGFMSELGTFILESSVLLHVYSLTQNNKAYAGICHSSFLFFFILGSFIGGVLGTKLNRLHVLVGTELARIVFIIPIFFLTDPWHIIISYGLIALCTGIFNPSRQSLVNQFVPPEHITEANSLFGTTWAILHLVGPLVGAHAYAYFGGISNILYFNLITYILGPLILSKINYKTPITPSSQKASDFSLKEYNFVFKRIDLIGLFINQMVSGICIGILISLILPFTKEVLLGDAKVYGQLMALFGLGGLIGGPICHYLSRFASNGKLITLTFLAEIIIFPIWMRTTWIPLNFTIIFIWGVVVFIKIPSQFNHISQSVKDEYLPKCHALLDICFLGPSILGGLVVATMGEKYTTFELLNFASISFILICVLRVPFKEFWSLWTFKGAQVERKMQL